MKTIGAKMRDYTDFPKNMSNRPFGIYPRKGFVEIDGFRKYKLKELKKIDFDTRLSFPHKLFVAIDRA